VKLTKSLPVKDDANGGDVYESCANVEPVDVHRREPELLHQLLHLWNATLEPEVWHILDTFENMFFEKN